MKLSFTACSFCIKKYNSKISNNIYSINKPIKVKNEKDEEIIYNNALQLFKEFFDVHKDIINNNIKNRAFRCIDSDNVIDMNNYIMYPIEINSGIYGDSSEIYDIYTKKMQYKKRMKDVELKKFFVIIVFPKDNVLVDAQRGMLIFQNIGPYGIKTMLTDEIDNYFKNNYNIVLRCATVAPSLFVNRVLKKNNIYQFTLVKNYQSSDSIDNYANGYGKETRTYAKLSFSEDKWDKLKDEMYSFINGSSKSFRFEDCNYDNAKVSVKIGEIDRTISLSGLEKLSVIESIPDSIKDKSGNADPKKLIEYLKNIIEEYLNEMSLTV